MRSIKGETITIIEREKTGTDAFGQDVFTETTSTVDNVLVIADSESTVTNDNIHGRMQAVKIGIPKGDVHNWYNCSVVWHGKTYRQTGDVLEGNSDMIPGDWDRTARGERYV